MKWIVRRRAFQSIEVEADSKPAAEFAATLAAAGRWRTETLETWTEPSYPKRRQANPGRAKKGATA